MNVFGVPFSLRAVITGVRGAGWAAEKRNGILIPQP